MTKSRLGNWLLVSLIPTILISIAPFAEVSTRNSPEDVSILSSLILLLTVLYFPTALLAGVVLRVWGGMEARAANRKEQRPPAPSDNERPMARQAEAPTNDDRSPSETLTTSEPMPDLPKASPSPNQVPHLEKIAIGLAVGAFLVAVLVFAGLSENASSESTPTPQVVPITVSANGKPLLAIQSSHPQYRQVRSLLGRDGYHRVDEIMYKRVEELFNQPNPAKRPLTTNTAGSGPSLIIASQGKPFLIIESGAKEYAAIKNSLRGISADATGIYSVSPKVYESIEGVVGSLSPADQERAERWKEQYTHWENVDAFNASMKDISADRVIDKNESARICFVLPQWKAQLRAAQDYVADYRKVEPTIVSKNPGLGT